MIETYLKAAAKDYHDGIWFDQDLTATLIRTTAKRFRSPGSSFPFELGKFLCMLDLTTYAREDLVDENLHDFKVSMLVCGVAAHYER